MKHIIIGTAGHIDHGKTTLIKALTGRDTDTLQEEKERGISINLGFTYFDLPSGKRAGIVDVPGHEKFVKNMLAGASGIDIVMLVIAADEGVMPQTREHFNIMSLLDVKKGIIVVTKKDMVDKEWLDVVIEDIRNYLKGTFLEDAGMVSVSSTTGEGIKELVKAIDELSEEVDEKKTDDYFRLPVDRVFTISGFGTVVTGTLINGIVSEGDRADIYPSQIETRVRNIQVHEQPVKSAFAGQRVAVNISGVKVENVKRGDILAPKGIMEPSMIIDCRLNLLKDAKNKLENRDRVRVYHGTNELFGRVVILDKEVVEPGDTCLAQIRLESPLSSLGGDRFVIRSYSPMITIGGGTIIDPNPTKRKRFDTGAIDELLKREHGNPYEIMEQILLKSSKVFPDISSLAKLSGIKESETGDVLKDLKKDGKLEDFSAGEIVYYVHTDFLKDIAAKITEHLGKYHAGNPLKSGISKEEIKSRFFEGNVKQKVFDEVLSILENRRVIRINNKYVSLYDFQIKLSPIRQKIRDKLIQIFSQSGVSGLEYEDAALRVEGAASDTRMVFELLVDTGELVRINENMVITRSNYISALETLKTFLESNHEITLAQYRDLLDNSRKTAVALLEYFDQLKITRRVGDKRVLV